MGRTKKVPLSKAKEKQINCRACQQVTKNGQNVCTKCANRIGKICDPNADNFNKVLADLISNTKLNCRQGLANKLTSALNPNKIQKKPQILKQ